MKKLIVLIILIAMVLPLICACSLLPEEMKICKIEFYVDGKLYDTKRVTFGQTVKMPDTPSKTNEVFVGWSVDQYAGEQYDFGKKVTKDMELHAYFTIDAIAMTNMLTRQTMRSIVTVENKCYNTVNGSLIETNSEISQGSGVVIDISGGYCYVLTNYHVLDNPKNYANQSFTVEDPWGNRYDAKIYRKSLQSQYAASEDYDLALVYFEYPNNMEIGLEEIAFGSNPLVNDYVATIGTPEGLQNTISYGRVLIYQKINAGDDVSLQKITFDVVIHNAHIEHGSSGSALINTSGQLVGINFAGYSDDIHGCTIPIDKVIEFMNTYVY